jgi:DNA-binding FadR family transcriptional regulator
LIRAVHGIEDFSARWLELELEQCDYRRPIARAIAARDPDAAAVAARDALAPAAEMLGAAVKAEAVAS